MYKLIAIDIDGTLLGSDGLVSGENIRALEQARGCGVHIVLATGRPPMGIARIRAQMSDPPDEYLIAFSGALTRQIRTGVIVSSHTITTGDYIEIAAFAESVGLQHYGYQEDAVLAPVLHPIVLWESDVNGVGAIQADLAGLDPQMPLMKVMATGEPDQVRFALTKIPAALAARFSIVSSAPNLLEFHNPLATKGQAVHDLASSLGIARQEVICIGDSGNDLDMVRYAGLGVAMGNASVEIRAVADYITVSNDDHGVAEVIGRFVPGCS